MAEHLDVRERTELVALLRELGPDAPTLCAGWTTADLAAHLVLREHFHRWPPARLEAEKARGYAAVVDRMAAGPPLVPWRVPGVRAFLNGGEYFIHHEDVRRANGRARRPDRPDLDDLCWRTVGFTGRRLAKRLRPAGVELRRPDGASRTYGGEPRVVLTGHPTELALWLAGRRGAAEVTLEGPPELVAAAEAADLDL